MANPDGAAVRLLPKNSPVVINPNLISDICLYSPSIREELIKIASKMEAQGLRYIEDWVFTDERG